MKLQGLVLVSFLIASSACDSDDDAPGGNSNEDEDLYAKTPEQEPDSEQEPDDEPGELDDKFCPHAWAGFEAREQYGDLINELSLTEVPVSKIQENGKLALGYAEDFRNEFEAARDFIVEDEARLSFEVLLSYEKEWMTPQAQLAADATSDMQYGLDSLDLLLEDGMAELTSEAALESGVAAAYTVERCGSFEAP